MSDFNLKGYKGTPPKDGSQYLAKSCGDWYLVCWWTSEEIKTASGYKSKGAYLEADGCAVNLIDSWVDISKPFTDWR